jgi:hypothetical protein
MGSVQRNQDIDPSYMWALLPQSVYDITTRNADLAHYGAVVYGTFKLSPAVGKLDYKAWGGEEVIPTDDGQFADLIASGNGPLNPFTYVTSWSRYSLENTDHRPHDRRFQRSCQSRQRGAGWGVGVVSRLEQCFLFRQIRKG